MAQGYSSNGHNGHGKWQPSGGLAPFPVQRSTEELLANIDAEKDVLTCLLQNPFDMEKVIDILKPDHFFRDAHRLTYRAMVDLYKRGLSTNLYNVQNELRRREELEAVESHTSLSDLDASPRSLKGVESFYETVIQKATYRNLLYAASRISTLALSEDPDAINLAMEEITSVALGGLTNSVEPFCDVVDRTMAEFNQRRADLGNSIARGLSTGFHDVDSMTGGLQPGHLIVLAARTGFGKSAWALNVALRIALSEARKVYIATLEMPQEELVERALSVFSEVDHSLIRDGRTNPEETRRIEAAAQRLRGLRLFVDDRSRRLAQICFQIQKLHTLHGLDLIVIDYLQLIGYENEHTNVNRAQILGEMSQRLKELAMTLRVPVIILSQLKRDFEQRGGEPMLYDISESGGLANAANEVIFLYVSDEEERKRREEARPFIMDVKVAKARQGREGKAKIGFAGRITKFVDRSSFDEGGQG